MDLSKFLENCVSSWESPKFDGTSFNRFSMSSPISPSQYLRFARDDLASGLEHRHINALSNAKRAMDCQLDGTLEVFGLKKKRNFPEKLEIIGEIGLLAPRIVRKVIRARNLLEHEFKKPDAEDVEDAVDVATLFLEVTSRPFRSFMEDYFVANWSSAQNPISERMVSAIISGENPINGYTFTESFYVSFEETDKTFWIDCVHDNQLVEEIEIAATHPFYKRMIRFAFDYGFDHHNHSSEEVGHAFVSMMGDLANEL